MKSFLFFLIKFIALTAYSQELPPGLDKALIKAASGTSGAKTEEVSILKDKLEEEIEEEGLESKKTITSPSNLDVLSQLEEENAIQSEIFNSVDDSFLLEEGNFAGDPSPLGENWGTLRGEMNEPGFSIITPIGTGDNSGENEIPVAIDWTTTQIKSSSTEKEISNSSSNEPSTYFPIIPD
jgi:hypothetical protein